MSLKLFAACVFAEQISGVARLCGDLGGKSMYHQLKYACVCGEVARKASSPAQVSPRLPTRGFRRRGAISTEYGVVAVLILAVVVGIAGLLGRQLLSVWSGSTQQVTSVLGGQSPRASETGSPGETAPPGPPSNDPPPPSNEPPPPGNDPPTVDTSPPSGSQPPPSLSDPPRRRGRGRGR